MKQLRTSNTNILHSEKAKFHLIPIIRKIISAMKKGEILTRNLEKYKKGTIDGYEDFTDILIEYQNRIGIIFLDDVNEEWVNYFAIFLTIEKKHTKASIANTMIKLKSIMGRCYRAGITRRNGACIIIRREYTHKIYLNLTDLGKIKNVELPEKMGVIRDIFIMNCFTGMRYSDFMKFIVNPKKHLIEDEKFISYNSKKTNKKAIIPVSKIVLELLKKYNYSFKRYSQQHYCKTVKEIAKRANLTELIFFNQTVAGEIVEIVKPKWKMTSPHTARRTFASLAQLYKIPKENIMKMTGHTTEQNFNKYVRISELESAIQIMEHSFFKLEI